MRKNILRIERKEVLLRKQGLNPLDSSLILLNDFEKQRGKNA